MTFISLRVRNALLFHGWDADNREIVEDVKEESFVEKLIAVERIQSVSERYILVSAPHERQMYWEYEGGFEALKARLYKADLLV